MGEIHESDQRSAVRTIPRGRRWTPLLLAVAVTVLLGIGALGGVLLARRSTNTTSTIPAEIAAKLDFTAQAPHRLPGGYTLVPGSFHTAEDTNALLFQARDKTGATLYFSEQRRPGKEFDFDKFYSDQIQNARHLDVNDQTEAVWGKAGDGRTTLSVATPTVWVLVITSSSLDEPRLQQIANDLGSTALR